MNRATACAVVLLLALQNAAYAQLMCQRADVPCTHNLACNATGAEHSCRCSYPIIPAAEGRRNPHSSSEAGYPSSVRCRGVYGVCQTMCLTDADCRTDYSWNDCTACYNGQCSQPTCAADGVVECKYNSDCGPMNASSTCACAQTAGQPYTCQRVGADRCNTKCKDDGDCVTTTQWRPCDMCDMAIHLCTSRSCGSRCTTDAQCADTSCPACVAGTCQVPAGTCGGNCSAASDCAHSGCTVCEYGPDGFQKLCQSANGCGNPCAGMDDCDSGECNYCDPDGGFTCDEYVAGKSRGPAPGTAAYHELVRRQREQVANGTLKLLRGTQRALSLFRGRN
eukprot:CAMPEP_0174854122 /NCGR_PEP_ID=MMETSP1114-20130205/30080_1 /TAXON_ID=312471 /ORGANISM="Neobodo designis, Strain CCAP 1951/1" /LENGTH=335 /DNA_ID=CAMNT_0016088797 /DNA_START=30 /DNA_END=1037 /DNA_ORIENTATION=+